MSFALSIGENANPGFSHGPNPGFRVWKTAWLPGFAETRVYNTTINALLSLNLHYVVDMRHLQTNYWDKNNC